VPCAPQSSSIDFYESFVEDSHLLPHRPDSSGANRVRGGGALRIISGILNMGETSFTRCSAGPIGGDFDSCALSFSASTSLCTDGLGGAVSAELASIGSQSHTDHSWRAASGG
jgi:hypothetical protein